MGRLAVTMSACVTPCANAMPFSVIFASGEARRCLKLHASSCGPCNSYRKWPCASCDTHQWASTQVPIAAAAGRSAPPAGPAASPAAAHARATLATADQAPAGAAAPVALSKPAQTDHTTAASGKAPAEVVGGRADTQAASDNAAAEAAAEQAQGRQVSGKVLVVAADGQVHTEVQAEAALSEAPAEAAAGQAHGEPAAGNAPAEAAAGQAPAMPGGSADGEPTEGPGSLSGVAALLSKLAALPAGAGPPAMTQPSPLHDLTALLLRQIP